jgi:MSHA biogenesis protein MshM
LWIAQWGLSRDPFADTSGTYVPLPGHEEAVARLLHTIESSGRLAVLSAPPGLGKTRVLGQALELARSPVRRIALAKHPLDGDDLVVRLAERLGVRVPASSGRGLAWGALERGIRLCTVQGLAVVLAVDGCGAVNSAETSETLLRIVHLGGQGQNRVTVLLVDCAVASDDDLELRSWCLAIRLKPLSVSEVEAYLIAKLTAAGCDDPIFTRRAVTRLQLLTGGNPRGVDRLGALCLMAGASRGLEAVSSELVESVAAECHVPPERILRA